MKEKFEKLLLRPSEAFEAIGIGRSTGYALIASGDLPAVRIGRSVRIPLDKLRDWIEQRIKTTAEENKE